MYRRYLPRLFSRNKRNNKEKDVDDYNILIYEIALEEQPVQKEIPSSHIAVINKN